MSIQFYNKHVRKGLSSYVARGRTDYDVFVFHYVSVRKKFQRYMIELSPSLKRRNY